MYPIIGKHTEENMSLTIERKEKDTISQETNCNRSLIAFLGMGHLLMEELMEGVEVNGVLSSSSRGKVSFWIDCDIG